MKIFEGLSNTKNMVFNVKKLQDNDMDLTIQKGMEKSAPSRRAADVVDLGRQWSVVAGERVNANVYQELLRQHVFS